MNAFAKVVATGSYAEAARRLGLTRSAVSKAVMGLEHLLGSRLLDRTTRKVTPTEAGRAYYEQALQILADVEAVEARVAQLQVEPKGVLKVNAPMSFGILHLSPLIGDFMARYPEIKIELSLNDRFIDPLEEGVDVTLRIGVLADSSLIARRLAPIKRALVAAPDYVAGHGAPARPEELAAHRCLAYGQTTARQRWQLKAPGGDSVSVQIAPTLCSNNGEVLRAAALAGNGITDLPTFIVGADLEAGRLVRVLPGFAPPELALFALYAPNRYLAAKTRAFIDFLVERFAGEPAWDAFFTSPQRGEVGAPF